MTYLTHCRVCKKPCASHQEFCSPECRLFSVVVMEDPETEGDDASTPPAEPEHEARARRIGGLAIVVGIMFVILFVLAMLDGWRKGGQAL